MPRTAYVDLLATDRSMDDVVARAAAVLLAGGSVVLPTDTVYGLAALPAVPGATDLLFGLKGRSGRQPLAVLVSDVDQAAQLVEPDALSPRVVDWMNRLWPGALTLVLRRSPKFEHLDLGGPATTIGVRCPDHPFLRSLAAAVGPVATTSANRHGQPTPLSAKEAAESLGGPVDLVVDGGPAGATASTVVDATGDGWRILRAGAVSDAMLEG